MNEEQFRERFKEALGSAPVSDLSRQIEAAVVAPRSRPRVLSIGSLAATAAILVVGGFAGWRLVDQHRQPAPVKTGVNGIPTVVPSANHSANLALCRMPVVVMQESGPPGQLRFEAGFIDTGTGQYTTDHSASVAGLPGGAFVGTNVKPSRPSAPSFYSETLHRWLPVDERSISPDGASYVWERLLPEGSNYSNFGQAELHRFDVATRTDRTLWTYPGSIDINGWDASGIRVDTVPAPSGGQMINWLIDPATGSATQQVAGYNAQPRLTQLPSDPLQNGGFAYGNIPGAVFRGHQVWRIGSRGPGSPELVVYETAPGQRVTIYKGAQGDATHFDPDQGLADVMGIWFTDYQGGVLWRWQLETGLRKIGMTGLPQPLSGPNSGNYLRPAGTCVPLP